MHKVPEISKAAFLARINNRAGRFAVDTYYERTDGSGTIALVVVYDDGAKNIFRGFNRAA